MSSRKLHVVTAIANPMRYASRDRLLERWLRKMIDAGTQVTVVELVYDDRITVTDRILDKLAEARVERRHHGVDFVPVRTRDVMWHKEDLINLGFAHLPHDWRYAAWVDADVEFHRPGWDNATIDQLNLHAVVQCWSHAQDLDPQHRPVHGARMAKSFMAAYRDGDVTGSGRYDDHNWHPGYAWAIRRDAYEDLGGLLDVAILGAGDRHMAMSLVGKGHLSYPGKVSDGYKRAVLGWQERAEAHIHRNVGVVDGMITHWWHGPKRNRRYADRWQILVRNHFDPATDLREDRDSRLWRWARTDTPRMRNLRDEVRAYFRARDEDSTEAS